MNQTTNITFIIPSVGRDTLHTTIDSLLKQTCSMWKAIVVFDGAEPSFQPEDDRFLILKIEKREKERDNCAGYVRNYGIQFATTDWIAFVDDDDTLRDDYVERFIEESNNYDADVIIFRMVRYKYILIPERLNRDISDCIKHYEQKSEVFEHFEYTKLEGDIMGYIRLVYIHPCRTTDNFYQSKVGISFAVKKYIFQSGIQFTTGQYEDFQLLDTFRSNKYKIMISPHIVYIVKDTISTEDYATNRVFINF